MFFSQELAFQLLGRIAFPIFAWLIANGYWCTRNVNKYLGRLFVFALLSQIPFTLALQGFSTNLLDYLTTLNVLFTLLLGLAGIVCYEHIAHKWLGLCTVLVFALLASLLRTDYGGVGVLSIFFFHIFRTQYGKIMVVQLILFLLLYSFIFFTWFDPVALLLIIFFMLFTTMPFLLLMHYNGQSGPKARYFFYIFYPGHLLVLYSIQYLLLVR
jgi:hypothetical protein